jgi:hypothetical protein
MSEESNFGEEFVNVMPAWKHQCSILNLPGSRIFVLTSTQSPQPGWSETRHLPTGIVLWLTYSIRDSVFSKGLWPVAIDRNSQDLQSALANRVKGACFLHSGHDCSSIVNIACVAGHRPQSAEQRSRQPLHFQIQNRSRSSETGMRETRGPVRIG